MKYSLAMFDRLALSTGLSIINVDPALGSGALQTPPSRETPSWIQSSSSGPAPPPITRSSEPRVAEAALSERLPSLDSYRSACDASLDSNRNKPAKDSVGRQGGGRRDDRVGTTMSGAD